MATNNDKITQGSYSEDLWDKLDFHLGSYVKSPIQLRYVSTRTGVIGRALRRAVVDLIDNIINQSEYIEDETTVLGTENRLYHSRNYTLSVNGGPDINSGEDKMQFEISSIAPTIFAQLRENIGIPNKNFRRSFFEHHLKDFTNPGKSGSLMYKTYDDLFILKTLRDYEARLLLQILTGYHLQLTQRSTLFNRYIGLYSVRFQAAISTIELYIVVMVNAFTPSLQINEIFDLKGSKIKRKIAGNLSADKLHKLKDLDFMELYPHGIRIPRNICQKLKIVIANDAKVLKKLNITDFSLILGIRHLDMTDTEMMQRRPTTGVAALLHMSQNFGLMHLVRSDSDMSSPPIKEKQIDFTTLPVSYLKPLQMLNENLDRDLYYDGDSVAFSSLPIPGIVNKTNQRVYLYFAFVDMLQTFDSFKHLDQTFRKLTDYNRQLEYSVIQPDDYEKRINQFLFESVFIDANDDFPWAITEISEQVDNVINEDMNYNQPTIEDENLDSVLEFRF